MRACKSLLFNVIVTIQIHVLCVFFPNHYFIKIPPTFVKLQYDKTGTDRDFENMNLKGKINKEKDREKQRTVEN